MKNVVNMSKEDKRFIFNTTAMNMKTHPSIIEKDFFDLLYTRFLI